MQALTQEQQEYLMKNAPELLKKKPRILTKGHLKYLLDHVLPITIEAEKMRVNILEAQNAAGEFDEEEVLSALRKSIDEISGYYEYLDHDLGDGEQ